MAPSPESFRYEADLTGRINGRSFYWRLPSDVRAKHELLAAFGKSLWFPREGAQAWDELLDWLCDLEWIPDRKIVLVHETLPRLPEADLRVYLAVLSDAVRWWRGDSAHELEVVFPASERGRIADLMAPRPPGG